VAGQIVIKHLNKLRKQQSTRYWRFWFKILYTDCRSYQL